MYKIQRFISGFLTVVCFMALCSVSASAGTYASERFNTKSITISSSFNVTFRATTFDTCENLGLKSYTLYTSSGTSVTSATPETYKKTSTFKTTIDLSSYVEKGKSYYVTATFYADGETKTITSTSRKY